jgi:hypothetical protein
MNMNCSGHAELRDPDWYDPNRSLDRAKSSPSNATVETDTTGSMLQNSFTSLNLDSFTVAELNDPSYNHFSIRSLPVLSSNNTNGFATAADAPWNESPRSLRGAAMGMPNNNSSVRSTRAMKPPPGVSALDHLQNSLSSLAAGAAAATASMMASNHGLPHDIITLEDDSEYESLAGVDEQDDNLYGSFASLRLSDVMNSGNENNEMDATAHAGNVHRSHARSTGNTTATTSHQYQHHQYPPSSPQRSVNSVNRSNLGSPFRTSHAVDHHYNSSYASGRSTTSSPSRASRNRYYQGAAMNESPSFSTLGEHTEYYNDGCDMGDHDNDDTNMEIIKVLRDQVETLKQELLSQQDQNQNLKQQYEYKNQVSQFLPMDSIVQHGSSGLCSFGHDSFISNKSNSNNNPADQRSDSSDVNKHQLSVQQLKQLADAETGIFGSIAALKSSFQKHQKEKENRRAPSINEQQPISPESDESVNSANDEDQSSCLLLDELVLCELEAHIKTVQRLHRLQYETLKQNHDHLQEQIMMQTAANIADP